ncbi:hypothetical protein DPQ33_08355 [Oceanidesulfovibrio indonesiensis]|uniref:Adenylate cyclase class-I N-terminal domain-containing protein n=1 Tax=Oceanidesulfovibrio indonesiensis TaxID=54767 RepID=A0A7M3MFD7_9BACT|nr:class I adenylate cyclase [Oceanidesulfovibrio indonesiensis]TVM17642.1 hypothetical protein DPQ33_08355 [Oceanidesulfovibrio indonesiensis]
MPASLADIIARLRDIRRSGATSEKQLVSQLQSAMDEAFARLEQISEGSERAVLSGGLAYALSSLAPRLQETRFLGQLLSRLLETGPLGEILCLRILREATMTMERLAAVLGMCEPHQQLALANRFFRNPTDMDRRRLAWAVATVRRIQADDPEETLMFLDRLEARDGELACPVQRELMRGRFGVWVLDLLRMELDDEQLAYMARIVGALGAPSLARELARRLADAESVEALEAMLGAVGRAGEPRSAKLVEAIRPYLAHARPRVRYAALEALQNLRAAGALADDAEFIQQQHQQLLCRMLAQFSAGEYRKAMAALDPVDRQEAVFRLTAMVRRLDGDWLEATAERQARRSDANQEAMELVLRAFGEFAASQPTYRPRPTNIGKQPVLAGKAPLKAAEADQPVASGMAPVPDSAGVMSGRKVRDAKLCGNDQSGAEIVSAAYRNSTIESSDFTGARLEATRFQGCTFRNVDFTEARLTTVSFSGCAFIDCLFEGSLFEAVSFRDCRFTNTHMTEAKARRLRLVDTSLSECDVGGAILEGLEAESTSFGGCHFGAASLLRGVFSGVEFAECCFADVLMLDMQLNDVEVVACSFGGSRFHNIRGGEPVFRGQEERTRRAAVERMLSDVAMEPPPALSSSEGQQFLHALLWRWLFENDARRRLRAFRQMNRNRRLWASAMLRGESRDLLALLPALVEAPEAPGAALPPLGCAIAGHTSNRTVRTLMEQHGLTRPDRGAQNTLRIEALYAIGSTGTIAQDRSSDLDLWVCYDKNHLSELHARALRTKLAAIEQWAWSTFGLEVHFFLMDLQAIHENDFGYSDEESAGSTQALLLKEEFYRTAMLLAGRPPSWWATAPRLGKEQYASCQTLLNESVSLQGEDFLDLGVMEAIPRDEYFGAALWQIVKALKSPFKSILKIALLDKYSTGEERRMLLCETIKEALFDGRCDLWEVDPYAVMFREVFEHYHARGNKEACDLLRLAFNKKTGLTLAVVASDKAFAMRGYSYLEYFFPYSEATIAGRLERRLGEDEEDSEDTFAALVAAGDRILRFMLNAYAAVQERLAGTGPSARVSPEDMTTMGRRIAARLAPGPNKVLPLPFIRMRPGMLTGLEFSWQPTGKSESVWSVRAEFPKREGGKPAPETLRSEKSPEELAAWLVANEIYDPSVLLTAQSLEPPLSIPDMQNLLSDLREFFPVPRIFDPPVRAGLQDERAARVFVTVNLTIPREVRRISRIAVVWSTTWGQLFCKARLPATEKLRSDPFGELVKAMGMPMAPKPAVMFHVPHKAHCPAVRLLNT